MRTPPSAQRPDTNNSLIPFWFWNDRLSADELVRQICEMKKQNIGGFFMHARFGLEIPYLSDKWFEFIRLAVETAKRLNMKAWIYDDYPFPSGIGGLKVTENPENRGKFLDYMECWVSGPSKKFISPLMGHPLAVALRTETSDWKDASFDIVGDDLIVSVPAGTWMLGVCWRRTFEGDLPIFQPDYLSPSAMQQFFHITLDPYEEVIGEYFGETVPGIFTDEPTIVAWHQDHPDTMMKHHDSAIAAWGKQVEDRLREMGYAARDVALAVFSHNLPNARPIRRAYRKVVADLFRECFLEPYARWCEDRGLILTGHFLLEEGLHSNLIFAGDLFRSLKTFHMPGCDHLGMATEGPYGGWGNLWSVPSNVEGYKQVSSAAHARGTQLAICETFGCAGWTLRLEDMKRIVDWLFTLGITVICPHAVFYSTKGPRKHDAPPSQFLGTPYWEDYHLFANYVGRVAALLQNSTHAPDVAILYPYSSISADYCPGRADGPDVQTEDFYVRACSGLLHAHVDFEIVDEDRLAGCHVLDNGAFSDGNETWGLLVIPPITEIAPPALSVLQTIAERGCAMCITPEANRDAYFLLPGAEHVAVEGLASAIRARIELKVGISSDSISHIQKRIDKGWLFFLANNTEKTVNDVRIQLGVDEKPFRYDPETGSVEEVGAKRCGRAWQCAWTFAPSGSLVLLCDDSISERGPLPPRRHEFQPAHSRPLDGPWPYNLHDRNRLTLPRGSFSIHGLTYEYETVFQSATDNLDLFLYLDNFLPSTSSMGKTELFVFLNNTEQQLVETTSDGCFAALFSAKKTLRKGLNHVRIVFKNSPWGAEPKALTEPVQLVGAFAVSKNIDRTSCIDVLPDTLECGDWCDQGFPEYAGRITYHIPFTFNEHPVRRLWLDLPRVGDYAKVSLNGRDVGTRAWPPFLFDLTAFLRAGCNQLSITVSNNTANRFTNARKPSGLLEPPVLRWE